MKYNYNFNEMVKEQEQEKIIEDFKEELNRRTKRILEENQKRQSYFNDALYDSLKIIVKCFVGFLNCIWKILEYCGPKDTPTIIAIFKKPDEVYCPCCGSRSFLKYCSKCGKNIDKEWEKQSLKLVNYVVENTEEIRNSLSENVSSYLREELEKQKRILDIKLQEETELMKAKLQVLERVYVMEVVRQRKEMTEMQKNKNLIGNQNGR